MSYVRVLVASGLAVCMVQACQSEDAVIARCKLIPEGGCPETAGIDMCEDRTCTALYRCNINQTWSQTRTCSPREDAGASGNAKDAAARDVSVDAPPGAGGGPGCAELSAPDCTLLFALSCPSGCCECEDIFVCEDGGWNVWGTCIDGALTPAR